MRRTHLSALVLACALLSVSASAQPLGTPHSTVELLAGPEDASGMRWVGIHFRLDPDWHVYWRNPGDSGEPPKATWSLPEGVKAGEMLWPVPKRIPVGPLLNFGYEERLLLPVALTRADKKPITGSIAAKLTFLICKIECLPAEASLSLELPAPAQTGLFQEAFSRIPKPFAGRARAGLSEAGFFLEAETEAKSAHFFPEDESVVENAAEQKVSRNGDFLRMELARATGGTIPDSLRGVWVDETGAWSLAAPLSDGAPAPPALFHAIFLAFLGGLLLNLMPCVFPVLSLKALSFLKDPGQAARSAPGYCAGVLVSFWILAGALLSLRSAGQALGWGFQLQSPVFVALLAVLFLALGLNFLGVFEIGIGLSRLGGGGRGAFATGALAVVAATPCTAPFMGAALGFALLLPPLGSFAVFTALGAGMAAPYALLALNPGWLRILPKPGPWLLTFKKAMSVPMFLTALWLVWVFARQFAPTPAAAGAVAWKTWSQEAVAQARHARHPVLVNYTAAWCITCQVNDRVALGTPAAARLYERTNTEVFKADWTSRDDAITRALQELGRNGIPVYAYYAPGAEEAELLPALLTPGILERALTPREETK